MADKINPLKKMNLAELHDEGLGYLHRARLEFAAAPTPAAAGVLAMAFFFASLSADNLAAVAGEHRSDEKTPPRGVRVPAEVPLA